MFNETTATLGGDVIEKEPKVKKPSRAARIAAWKKENQAAYEVANSACCVCTPTRAQALLVDQFNGNAPIPID